MERLLYLELCRLGTGKQRSAPAPQTPPDSDVCLTTVQDVDVSFPQHSSGRYAVLLARDSFGADCRSRQAWRLPRDLA